MGVEGELTVIQVVHSEFDVGTVKLIVTWRTGKGSSRAYSACNFFCLYEEDKVLGKETEAYYSCGLQ